MTDIWQVAVQTANAAVIVMASVLFLHRAEIRRPPIGRFTRADIVIITCIIVGAPFVYIALPTRLVSLIFGFVFCIAIETVLASLIRPRIALLITAALAVADLVIALSPSWTGQYSTLVIVNDVIVGAAVVGVCNLWAQSGAQASSIAVLAGVLAIYDPVATWASPLMRDLFVRLTGQPFAAMLSLTGHVRFRLGLGDILMLALWPAVLAKAYGRGAAWLGAFFGLATLFGIELAFAANWLGSNTLIAVMSIYGPLIVGQYLFLRVRCGRERKIVEWRDSRTSARAVGVDRQPVGHTESQVAAALTARRASDDDTGLWTAYLDGVAVAAEATPALARRAARRNGYSDVPVVLGR
jgi:hypothetical protein